MLVISTTEFRNNPIPEDDTLLSKEEFEAIIEQGFQNIKEGKGTRYTLEELRIKMGL